MRTNRFSLAKFNRQGGKMKLTRSFVALAVSSLFVITVFSVAAAAQANTALQRGYRTGYSDGYMAGYRDTIDNVGKSPSRHSEYNEAARAYNKEYGAIEDYRDGYRQGFEAGYEIGFAKKTFDSTIPGNLRLRGSVAASPQVHDNDRNDGVAQETQASEPPSQPVPTVDHQQPETPSALETATVQNVNFQPDAIMIAKDTELVLELQDDLSTETTREGERFTAKIVGSNELNGALIEGRIEKIQMPGRLKRRAELQLTFDRVVLDQARWANFSGILIEVVPLVGDNVSRISNEGTAIGQSSVKDDAVKLGIATGAGAGIGAIAGGPVGAAIGAGVGAAYGIGSAVVDRGKHIRLNKNQQIRVRSSYDVVIR